MSNQIIYHGSNVIVQEPKVLQNGFFKDFGYGFYCTGLLKQAKRWANTRGKNPIVNCYLYEENPDLGILSFKEICEDWLEFVVKCRRGIEHGFDIVEGPMADDQVWDYVEDYSEGRISKAAFWELIKFKYPTHQIVFCTQESLKTLKWTGVCNE